MTNKALTHFIGNYISSRRQTKLDTFEKEAIKRLARGEDESVIAQSRRELEDRYQPRNWLTEAAKRAEKIAFVTHAAKYTHGGSKCSSFYRETASHEAYVTTASLITAPTDAVCDAAVLDVAKLLQTEVEGDSLLACLKRGDRQPLRFFARDDEQLALWVEGFNKALKAQIPVAHKLAKQVFFPVDGGYHLLCPLFATSLAHVMHERLSNSRFGAAHAAHRAGQWHPTPDVRYPHLAEMHFGGTKPQNISALNSARGGRIWLLPAQPPAWRNLDAPPKNMMNLFSRREAFHHAAAGIVLRMAHFLKVNAAKNSVQIRSARAAYVDELIDLLFNHAATCQQEGWQGWTQYCPQLPRHQQLWLDPWRGKNDAAFASERERGDWRQAVAGDFARWLNQCLNEAQIETGLAERREWRTRSLFRQRLREMEAIIQEALK